MPSTPKNEACRACKEKCKQFVYIKIYKCPNFNPKDKYAEEYNEKGQRYLRQLQEVKKDVGDISDGESEGKQKKVRKTKS